MAWGRGGRWTEEQLARTFVRPVPVLCQRSHDRSPRPDYAGFLLACRALGLPAPAFEHRFHPTRKWRLDLAWPVPRVGVEVEGGLWSQSQRARMAHATPTAILRDMEKHNAAVMAGWRVLRYTPDQLEHAASEVAALLAKGGA